MTGLPPSPWRLQMTTVRAVTPETPGVQTYDLTFDDAATDYSFRPGQFNMLYLPGVGEAAISLSSDPEEPSTLRHTVRVVGNVTRAMSHLRPSDKVGVRGPFGTAWPVTEARGRDVVVVAGGLGLAPLRPAIYYLRRHRADYGRVALIYGTRTPADLLYPDEYEDWRQAGIEVQPVVNAATPDWNGPIGTVMPLLASLTLDPSRTVLLTCGPEVMMRFVGNAAADRGVPVGQVFVSLERNMNCAVGLCGHCQLGAAFVCKDGPVFPFDRVRRLMHVENF
jgi:NAD(P)H-flavin reductase